MKKTYHYLRSLLGAALLLSSLSSYATHIVGIDLFYTYVSGSTYKITLVAYGDCAGSAFPSLLTSSPQICVYDGNTSVGSLYLTLQSPTTGVEITPVCPADTNLTQCTSISYTIPGIKKFVYSGNYTLPYTSSVWRFLFTGNMGPSGGGAGRGSTITNIVGPGSSIIQLVDTLNNVVYHNTSPTLTILPTPFFCLNNPDTYNPGASDPDGDSLSFHLVSAINGTTVCPALGSPVTYVTPYTPTAPLATSSFLFDSKTGQITFYPNILQRSLVVYNIEEYRSGTMVGTCQREMTFLVLTCTTSSPWGGYTSSTAGTIIDSTDFSICSNAGAFSITMTTKEADTSYNINVTATGLPSGITFSTVNNNTNHPVSTISGTTTGMAPGTYIYYVTYKNDACPLNGVRTEAFTITILPAPGVKAGPGASICIGSSTTLSVTGASTYLWTPSTGLSCTTCSVPVSSLAVTTLYTVTGTASNGCSSSDTVRVKILSLPTLSLSAPPPICLGSTTTLSVSGAVSYVWTPATGLSCTTCYNPIASPTATTTYSVTGTDANGCVNKTTATVTVNSLPAVTVAPVAFCSGTSATLFPSGAVSYTWSPGSGLSCTSCTNPVASVTVTTTYTVTGTDINGCKGTALLTVSVTPTPAPPSVVSPVHYCLNATATALTATGSSLLWYTALTGGTGSPVAPIPPTTKAGSTTWYVSQTVGGCESARSPVTVTINPLPTVTIAPSTAVVCKGFDTTLTGGGAISYSWSPATGLSTSTGSIVKAHPTTTTTYTVTGTDINGCVNKASITVSVNPLPNVTIAPAAICSGVSATLFPTGAISYIWSPGSGLSCTSCTNPITSVTVTTTYTVTGTDINGCKDTTTVTVNVSPTPPPPSVVSPVVYCLNVTATALTATGASLLWYTTPTGGTGSPIAPIPPTTRVGSTTWYVSQTVGGCESARSPITVTINPLPVVTISPTTAVVCKGLDTTLTGGGAISYSWSPATGLSTSTGSIVKAHPATTTTYTVTGTDINGCVNKAAITVSVNPLPTVTIAPAAICSGVSATLFPTGAISYIWSPGSGLSCTSCTNPITSVTVTTTYTVTGTDINGCKDTTTVTVNVSPTPPPPSVVSPVVYCLNATATALTATGASLLWYTTPTGGTGSPIAPIPSTTTVGSTTWYVSQTVGGCESARSPITVTINALPIITISPATAAVCIGKDTTLTASGAVSYTWSPATGLSSTTGAVVKAHPTTTTTYIVTGTATTGCSDTASRVVIVNPLPTPVVPSATICNGSSATLTAGGAMVYTWSPASSLSSSAGISVIASPAITTTYTITGTNSFNCTNTTTATVRVNPVPPKPGVVSPVHYCQYATATALTATGTSLLWYTTSTGGTGSPVAPIPPTATVGSTTWYVSQTVGGCESSRSPVTVNVTHLPAVTLAPAAPAICAGHSVTLSASGAITYNWLPFTGLSTTTGAVVVAGPPVTTSYTVTGTDAVGCSNTDTITVIVHPLPVIKILPANPFICLGSDVILTASGAVAYMWSPSATLSASSGASVIAKPGTTTLYTITGYDLFGCTGSAIDTVNVSPVPPPPAVISPVIYCQNAIASPLSATGLSLLWYTTATGGVGGTVTPVPSTARVDTSTWYVSQTVNGCEGPRDSIKVIVRINAETDFSFKINYGCINDTVSFTNNSKYTYKYLWDFGDNTQDTITNPVHYYHAVTQSTDFKVILFGGNQYCFGDSTKEILTLNPSPGIKLINVTPDQTIPYGSSIPLNADGADTWSWSPDDGTLSALHIHNPVATPKDDNTYIVYGTDLHGCMDSAIIHIFLEYEDSPFVPTAFTPNGDGENDFARILNLRHNKLIDFRIFNRWGQVVFNTTDVNQGWDGKFLGAPQDLGVFVYIFTISDRKGTLRSYKGNITLIR